MSQALGHMAPIWVPVAAGHPQAGSLGSQGALSGVQRLCGLAQWPYPLPPGEHLFRVQAAVGGRQLSDLVCVPPGALRA